MGMLTGLKAIEDAVNRASGDDAPKAKWVSLKGGQQVLIHFLQEFDEDNKNYSPKNGTVRLLVEHSSPGNYRRKAACTADNGGECVGCEMARANPKTGWHQKSRLYTNVLVNDGKNDPYVAILSQGLSGKAITPTLLEYAKENDGITTSWYKLTRTGSDVSSTSYSLIETKQGDPIDVTDYELYDLEEVVTRHIVYGDQRAFYEIDKAETDSSAPAEDDAFTW